MGWVYLCVLFGCFFSRSFFLSYFLFQGDFPASTLLVCGLTAAITHYVGVIKMNSIPVHEFY